MPYPAPILAFFTHPWMLFWAVAAAAPILIHLLNRRRYREQPWAAMEYLLAAMRKNVRRIQIEQWVLLALRTLLILLLVAAVADPVIQSLGLPHAAGARTHRLFVLDGSYSMAYQPNGATCFDRAKQVIAQIVGESPHGDGFTLILMSEPPKVIVPSPAFARAEFLEELAGVSLPHGGGDLSGAMTKAVELLRTARRDERKLIRDEVYIVSDLCGGSWRPDDAAAKKQLRAQAEALTREGAALVVVDVGQSDTENTAVTHLSTADGLATCRGETRFEAQLAHLGRQNQPAQRVQFFVDGARAGEETVELQAGGTASVAFRHRFDTPGDHAVEVRSVGDRLDIDNHRWLSLPVKERLRVLCVDGNPGSDGRPGAADFLRVALAPSVDRGERNLVEVEVASEATWLEHDLAQFDGVFLTDVHQFTAAEAQALDGYLKLGGGLVIFLGPQVDAQNYNDRLNSALDHGPRVLPATIGELVAENRQAIDPLGYRHAIVSPFRDQEQSGLLTTPIRKYFRLTPAAPRGAKVVAAFTGGDAWIVEAPVHGGVSILVATSAADRDWTLLPVWPSFVPLVQEMLIAAIQGRREDRNTLVGRPLGGSLGGAVADVPVTLRLPDGEKAIVKSTTENGQSRWSFGDTWTSGVYRAAWEAPTSSQSQYAVNVDPSESDLSRADESDLRQELWIGVPFQYTAEWRQSAAAPSATLGRAAAIHRGLLAAALGVMFLESTLAWFFGVRSA